MIDHWEWNLLGYSLTFLVGIYLLYVLIYEWLVWKNERHWFKQLPKHPIYGPADLYRLKGPQAKPNMRVVGR